MRPISRTHTKHLLNGEFELLPWLPSLLCPILPALHTSFVRFVDSIQIDLCGLLDASADGGVCGGVI